MPIRICLLFVTLQSQQVFELHLSAVVLVSVELDMAWHDKASHSYLLVPNQLDLFIQLPSVPSHKCANLLRRLYNLCSLLLSCAE
jgi:hypothetical protein